MQNTGLARNILWKYNYLAIFTFSQLKPHYVAILYEVTGNLYICSIKLIF